MRRAFTLIELLVVIAIIAILAAILFPVFAQAKEQAKKTACLSNTKQMALGIYMYTNDSDDIYPQNDYEQDPAGFMGGIAYNPANPNGTYQITWTYLVQPYIKNWGIFVCPSDNNVITTDNPCPNGVSDIGKLNSSGQMYCDWAAQQNSYIPVYNVMPAHDWVALSITSYSAPANQIAVTEHRNDNVPGDRHKGASGFYPSQPCPQWPLVAWQASGKAYSYFPQAFLQSEYAIAQNPNFQTNASLFKKYDVLRVAWDRHSGGSGSNYAFADGHAKYQNLGQTVNPSAYEYGDVWYPNSAVWNSSPCP